MTVSQSRTVTMLLGILASAFVAGCGSSNPAPTDGQNSQAAQPAPSSDGGSAAGSPPPVQPTASSDSNQPRRQNERWADADGREYLGMVPLDVFFDQPYSIASDVTPLGGAAPAGTGNGALPPPASGMGSGGSTPQATDTAPESTSTASSGSLAWDEMVPLDVLKAEVTSIRNFLNQTLQSVGSYNSSMLMIPPKAAAIAVLSEIATEHPEAVSWKDDAVYIRDLAKQMNESTLQRGKKDQSRLLTLFENMTDTFNRSRPSDLEKPPAEDSFVDVAEMRFVMMRMGDAEKKMKTEGGSESAFGSKKDMINHEAAILGTMTKVITLEGYGYEDDDEFIGYAQKIVDAAKSIRDAAAADDFNSYELALSKIATACQECHSVYKNN